MTKLHAVSKSSRKRIRWCGPSAIAAITGMSYDDALQATKDTTGRRIVKWMRNWEMFATLQQLGYSLIKIEATVDGRTATLARFGKKRQPEWMNETILLNVTRHYVVMRGRKIVDNRTEEPVFLRQYPKRRVRVRHAWIVRKKMVAKAA